MKNILIPHKGLNELTLYSCFDYVTRYLDENKISYRIDVQDNGECTVKYNWRIVVVNDSIKLFFSEGNLKLFKITVENSNEVKLPNGICVGMDIEDALKIDAKLEYNDWDEIYESGNDYYLEDSLETGLVVSINVYIKEMDLDDFDLCQW